LAGNRLQAISTFRNAQRPQYVSVRESVAVCGAYKDALIDVGKV